MNAHFEDSSDFSQLPYSDSHQRVYFVPYRWWKDSLSTDSDVQKGISYSASSVSSYRGPMKIINNIFSSSLVFNLRREEGSVKINENGELVVSGKDYALVSGEMWLQHSSGIVILKLQQRMVKAFLLQKTIWEMFIPYNSGFLFYGKQTHLE